LIWCVGVVKSNSEGSNRSLEVCERPETSEKAETEHGVGFKRDCSRRV
jgi:hypothetical protein